MSDILTEYEKNQTIIQIPHAEEFVSLKGVESHTHSLIDKYLLKPTVIHTPHSFRFVSPTVIHTPHSFRAVSPVVIESHTHSLVDEYIKDPTEIDSPLPSLTFSSTGNNVIVSQGNRFHKLNYSDFIHDPLSETYHFPGQDWGSSYSEIADNRRKADVNWFKKWSKSGIGAAWVQQQMGLQLMQPHVETLLNLPLSANRIYLPIKTGMSLATAGTGLRNERSGLLGDHYDYYVNAKVRQLSENVFGESVKFNRLIKLGSELQLFSTPSIFTVKGPSIFRPIIGDDFVSTRTRIETRFRSFGSYGGPPFLTLSEMGGPNSIFGVGFTDIQRAVVDNPVKKENITYSTTEGITGDLSNSFDIGSTYSNIKLKEYNEDKIDSDNQFQNVYTTVVVGGRSDPKNGFSGKKIETNLLSSYSLKTYRELSDFTNKLEGKFPGNDRPDIFTTISGSYMHSLIGGNISTSKTFKTQWKLITSTLNDYDQLKDVNPDNTIFIEFRRYPVNDNSPVLRYRAFMDGFSDKITPDWGSEVKYIGRPDFTKIYTGIRRTISFGFLIIKGSETSSSIGQKLNDLVKLVNPKIEYNKMVAPILTLKIADFIDVDGYLNNIDVSIDDEYIWDLNQEMTSKLNGEKLTPLQQPIMAKVTVSFDVLFTKIPDIDMEYYPTIRRPNSTQKK